MTSKLFRDAARIASHNPELGENLEPLLQQHRIARSLSNLRKTLRDNGKDHPDYGRTFPRFIIDDVIRDALAQVPKTRKDFVLDRKMLSPIPNQINARFGIAQHANAVTMVPGGEWVYIETQTIWETTTKRGDRKRKYKVRLDAPLYKIIDLFLDECKKFVSATERLEGF